MTPDQALRRLRAEKGSIDYKDVVAILESLGFVVERKGSAKHYVFAHPSIPGFLGSNFACPHRDKAPVKKSYVSNVMRVLRTYEHELTRLAGEKNG